MTNINLPSKIRYVTPYLEIIEKWFSNRDEYLVWRTAWRAHYAELTKQIRLLTQLRKTPLRASMLEKEFDSILATLPNHLQISTLEFRDYWNASLKGSNWWWGSASAIKLILKSDAYSMIQKRKQGKIDALELWKQSNLAVTAAVIA